MNKHYILHDHHNDNPTIVIGEICCNGCQVFHKNNAEYVFDRFDVSHKHRDDVMDLFAKYNPNEGFDFESFVNELTFYEHINLNSETNVFNLAQTILEYYYTDELRDLLFNSNNPKLISGGVKKYTKTQLDTLVTHYNDNVRWCVANRGIGDHMDIFVNDKFYYIRAVVANHGYHLDKLVNDPKWVVRYEVAKWAYKKHLGKLVNDPSVWVREEVAKHGNKEQLKILINDWYHWVSDIAKKRLANM